MKKHYRRKWSKKRNYPHSQYFLKNCNSLPRPIEPKDAKQILKKIRGKSSGPGTHFRPGSRNSKIRGMSLKK
jgi:hypothetical protein